MEWFSGRLKRAGVGGAARQPAQLLDKSAAVAGTAGRSVLSAVERVALTAALAPSVTAIHLSQGNLQAVEKTAADLLKASVDTVFASSKIAAAPYAVAADALAAVGGDGMKLGRGALAGGLAVVNLVPFVLNWLARLGGQTPAAQMARAVTTAPVEVVLASSVQAAHDVLKPFAAPIPKAVRKLLQDHFEQGLLDRARFLVSSFGLTVPEVINGVRAVTSNEIAAFTVLDVIVFSAHPDYAEPGIRRWAYGLAHVELYERLGVDGWTEKFVRHRGELEAQAASRAEQVASAVMNG